MTLSLPSERNWTIFHAVSTEHLSRREAAERFGLSSTRVQQIVQQVKGFLIKYGVPELLGVEPERLELAALRLCYDKLTWTSGKLMRAYQKAFETLEREASIASKPMYLPPAAIRMLLSSGKILMDQTRIATRMSKVSLALVEEHREAIYDPALEFVCESEDGPGEVAAIQEAASDVTTPPERGCTPLTDAQEQALFSQALTAPVTASGGEACDELFHAILRRKVAHDDRKASARRRRKSR
jgi:hypothetical protein